MPTNRLFIFVPIFLLVAGTLYWHLTKDLETYGITELHARPSDEAAPVGLPDMKASTCGGCHQAIYAEWKTTIHAQAWTDDYFQKDWIYDKSKQNCLNCHTPMKDQQPNLVVGFENDNYWKPILEPNPNFDKNFQEEGVTCAICHVRDGKIAGPHDLDQNNVPHPIAYDPSMRNGMEVCRRCHVTAATEEISVGNPNICSTMSEIEAQDIKPNCIECHMPKITRPLMAGFPARKGRQHLWRGGHDQAMVSKDLKIEVEQLSKKNNKYNYQIELTNIGTHHKLPTGTPDRHLVITTELVDANGEVVKTKEHKIIRRILWRPIVLELSDNRLDFEKPQSFEFGFKLKNDQPGNYLRITAQYHYLEQWRRDQLELDEHSHQPFTMVEKLVQVN